jgi:hypothetical protein
VARMSKALLAAASAAVLLSLAVGTASARRIEFSETHWMAVWSEIEPWVIEEVGELSPPISCPVTLSGSIHSRTISKVSGQLIGYVTRAMFGTCRGGRAIVLPATLPWHIRYLSFSGTLPNIEFIRVAIVGLGIQSEEAGGRTCLYLTTEARPATATFRGAGNNWTRIKWENASSIPRFAGDPTCLAARFKEAGQASVTRRESAATIALRLVQ